MGQRMSPLQEMLDKLVDKLLGWAESLVVMLPNVLIAVVVLAAALVVSRVVRPAVYRVLHGLTKNEPISQLTATLARLSLVLVGVFFALSLLQLDKTVTSLLAGVGVAGLALGFAFQDIAANFMSGIIMALSRPFDVGDLIEVAGKLGRVRRIALRASEIETLDGLSILIPNKDIFQSSIINYTNTPARRLDIGVGTAYGDDMPRVREVVTRAVQEVPHRDRGRDVEVFFEAFGDSSINFTVRIWLDKSDQNTYADARSEAMIAIKAALDQAGLTIPFPIRTLDFGGNLVGGESLSDKPVQLRHVEGTKG